MSYGTALALQEAVFARLTATTALTDLVGTAIYDAVPPGITSGTYVSLGREDVREASDKTGNGALHTITVSVVSDAAGFATAKAAAAAISDALVDANLSLSRGSLVWLAFHTARARRVANADLRRIDLRFRARTEDS